MNVSRERKRWQPPDQPGSRGWGGESGRQMEKEEDSLGIPDNFSGASEDRPDLRALRLGYHPKFRFSHLCSTSSG